MNEATTREIISRLERLEGAVFGARAGQKQMRKARGSKGPTAGIRLLISKQFFGKKRRLTEVKSALADNGYHYSSQAVDIALRRLGKKAGPLVVLKEGSQNLYVNRK